MKSWNDNLAWYHFWLWGRWIAIFIDSNTEIEGLTEKRSVSWTGSGLTWRKGFNTAKEHIHGTIDDPDFLMSFCPFGSSANGLLINVEDNGLGAIRDQLAIRVCKLCLEWNEQRGIYSSKWRVESGEEESETGEEASRGE